MDVTTIEQGVFDSGVHISDDQARNDYNSANNDSKCVDIKELRAAIDEFLWEYRINETTWNFQKKEEYIRNFCSQCRGCIFMPEDDAAPPLDKVWSEDNCVILERELIGLLSLSDPEKANLDQEISERVYDRIQCFISNLKITIDRIVGNLHQIQHQFAPDKNHRTRYRIAEINVTDSDPHVMDNTEFGGARVSVVTMVSETNEQDVFSVVYKPRNIKLESSIAGEQYDSLFSVTNRLLAQEQNSKGCSGFSRTIFCLSQQFEAIPTYRFLSLSDGHGYFGVVEYLSYEKSIRDIRAWDGVFANESQAKNYYKQLGRVEAISRIFGIRDLHQGNLIVHNKKPYFVDIETALSFVQLEGGKEGLETGLVDGISEFYDAVQYLTKNWCYSMKKRKDIIMQLYKSHSYMRAMKAGFAEVIRVYAKNMKQSDRRDNEMMNWLNRLSDSIKTRVVVIATSRLSEWPYAVVLDAQFLKSEKKGADDSLNEDEWTILRENNKIIRDLQQGNIPVFYQYIHSGTVYYRNDAIQTRVDSPVEIARKNLEKLTGREGGIFYATFKAEFIDYLKKRPKRECPEPVEIERDKRMAIIDEEQDFSDCGVCCLKA